MKKKAILLVTIIIIIVITITSSIILFNDISNNKPTKITEEKKNNETSTESANSSEKQSSKEEEINNTIGNYKENKIGESDDKEYPKEQTDSLYNELCNLANSASYTDISNKIDNLKNQHYKFTESYNTKIANIYIDSTVLLATKDVNDYEQKAYMISNLNDVHTYFTGTLMMDEKTRRKIIIDTESLNPIFKGPITVTNRTELSAKDVDQDIILRSIYDKEPSVQSVTKYEFSIEGYPLVAYIENFLNNTHAFFTIRNNGDVNCPYRTISYWNSIDSIIYNNN